MTEPAPSEPAPPSTPAAGPLLDDAATKRLLRWLPLAFAGHLVVGVPALLISLVVAWGTFVQARATQRMQQAAAWPFVSYDTSNYANDGRTHRINFTLTNNGVGPALLGPVELRYRGKVIRTPFEFLSACCGYQGGESMKLATSPATGVVLRPGEQAVFFDMADVRHNRRMLTQLERERWNLKIRACYCSIFDECWTISGPQVKPITVKACPTDWQVYRER